MITVIRKRRESDEAFLARFTSIFRKSGILTELKERRYFTPLPLKRRKKSERARHFQARQIAAQ